MIVYVNVKNVYYYKTTFITQSKIYWCIIIYISVQYHTQVEWDRRKNGPHSSNCEKSVLFSL